METEKTLAKPAEQPLSEHIEDRVTVAPAVDVKKRMNS